MEVLALGRVGAWPAQTRKAHMLTPPWSYDNRWDSRGDIRKAREPALVPWNSLCDGHVHSALLTPVKHCTVDAHPLPLLCIPPKGRERRTVKEVEVLLAELVVCVIGADEQNVHLQETAGFVVLRFRYPHEEHVKLAFAAKAKMVDRHHEAELGVILAVTEWIEALAESIPRRYPPDHAWCTFFDQIVVIMSTMTLIGLEASVVIDVCCTLFWRVVDKPKTRCLLVVAV
eukprot:CAMPEP_0180757964 /NCGR_PEP_ID=MMETSP1038_2-20121128/35036_1 /TAXON_ID=632150 /ORGANISM="Azadinium spinosum, Strain 3D9" /LENGTH=228 /DNA_ID=CAMNT_0022792031 /DNA_START=82 /DNA_END=768 /DNA_ORIENTATION=-